MLYHLQVLTSFLSFLKVISSSQAGLVKGLGRIRTVGSSSLALYVLFAGAEALSKMGLYLGAFAHCHSLCGDAFSVHLGVGVATSHALVLFFSFELTAIANGIVVYNLYGGLAPRTTSRLRNALLSTFLPLDFFHEELRNTTNFLVRFKLTHLVLALAWTGVGMWINATSATARNWPIHLMVWTPFFVSFLTTWAYYVCIRSLHVNRHLCYPHLRKEHDRLGTFLAVSSDLFENACVGCLAKKGHFYSDVHLARQFTACYCCGYERNGGRSSGKAQVVLHYDFCKLYSQKYDDGLDEKINNLSGH